MALVGALWLAPELRGWPGAFFLGLATVVLVVGGTRAALAIAMLIPLFENPVGVMFLVSIFSSAALVHEGWLTRGPAKGPTIETSRNAKGAANYGLVSVPAVSALLLSGALGFFSNQLSNPLLLQMLFILQSLAVVGVLLLAASRAPHGSSAWWVGLVFVPILAPLISETFLPIIGWLALFGAAIALHLGARSMVTTGLLIGLTASALLPAPPALIAGLLFVLLLAALVIPAAKTRGVVSLQAGITWQLAVLLAAATWVGWAFWQAQLALATNLTLMILVYVVFVIAVAAVSRSLLRTQRQPSKRVDSVMLVIGQLGRGGAEKQLVLLANSLAKSGVQTTIVSFHGGERRSQIDAAVDVIVLQEHAPEKIPWLVTVTPKLWFVIWRHQPQVVVAFLLYAYLSSIPMAAFSANATRVSARRSLGFFKEKAWLLRLERLVNSITNLMIANSNAVAEFAIRQEGLDSSKVKVIYNVLPEIWYQRGEAGSREGVPVTAATVLNVANLIGYKGQLTLVQAIAVVRREFPHTTLRIVGDGPERVSVTDLAEALDVPLEISGFSEVSNLTYQEGQIFVLSSTEEGMSNALMEAMAAGMPIVATSVGGNQETLGDCGLLVPPNDVDALASAITQFLAKPDLAKDKGESARSRARSLFDADDLGALYLKQISDSA